MQLAKQRGNKATILKMDLFDHRLEEHNNRFSDVFILAKVCAPETIHEFARQLVSFHKPIMFNYAAKFGMSETQRHAPAVVSTKPATKADQPTCDRCRALMETKVLNYCDAHEERFGGKILCRTCQTTITNRPSVPVVATEVAGPSCQECRAPVDAKVVAFCRINGRRFNKRVFYRACQTSVAITIR